MNRRTALRIAAALVAIAAVVLVVRALTGDDDGSGDGPVEEPVEIQGPADTEFTLARPDGWTLVSDEERKGLPGNPLAVMRREEGRGLLIVNAPAGTERDLDAVAKRLDRRLEKALPDFRKVNARIVDVKAGPALLYSYVRTRRATAHTTLVVPSDARTFTINAVVPAGADDAAREVGRMLFSFDL